MVKSSTLAALLSVSLLAACDSPKDANEKNFRKVIDEALAKECALFVSPRNFDGNSFPVTIVYDYSKCGKMDKYTQVRLDASLMLLVKAGLLSVSDGTVVRTVSSSCKAGGIAPTKTFATTELGKKYLINDGMGKVTSFCVGHYKVDEIERFTQPANLGTITSEVTFTEEAADMADWAKSPDLQKVQEDDLPGAEHIRTFQAIHGLELRRQLYLTKDGWRDVAQDQHYTGHL